MVIDFHTHAFPEKIANRAMARLSENAGGVEPSFNGTVEGLKQHCKDSSIDKAVLLNIATNPKQQKNVNDFAISLVDDSMIIPFGSIHPESPDAFNELDRLKSAGILGIKLHPDYQHFFVNEDRMLPIYEKIADLGFVTVFHSGYDIGYPDPLHCTPSALSEILPIFKGNPVVAAHLGGYMVWHDVIEKLIGKNIYFDTSFMYNRIPPAWAKEIIISHGADKILFGSDVPWSNGKSELRFVNNMGLSDSQIAQILSENTIRILQKMGS